MFKRKWRRCFYRRSNRHQNCHSFSVPFLSIADQWLFSKGPNFTDLERSIVSTKGVDDPFDVDHHSVNTRLALDGDSGHIVLKVIALT